METFLESILYTSLALIIIFTVMVLVYYVLNARNVKKRKQHFADLHQSLAKGQRVSFANGLYGKVVDVGKDVVEIQVKSGAIIEVSRYSISEIVK